MEVCPNLSGAHLCWELKWGWGRPYRRSFVFLRVGWGNLNPLGACWRRGWGWGMRDDIPSRNQTDIKL